MRLVLLSGVVLVLLLVPAAHAAQPREGSVSRAAPELVWKGTATGSPFILADLVLAAANHPIVCEAPFCDTFALHVADVADMRIESSSCENDVTAVEVEQPDGTRLFADGQEGSPRTIVDIKSARAGTYVVRTLVNVLPASPGAYVGHATLAVPPPRTTLTALDRSVPAKHAASGNRIRIALSSTAPITSIRAVLLGVRRSIVGSGRLAALDGRGSMVLTLSRKLRPGHYRVAITASDDTGGIATKSVLRVSRRHTHARSARHRGSPAPAASPARC